jgi:hypothetical protein
MKLNLKNFRVVIIDCPVFAFDDPFCTGLLGKALKMKLDGYSTTYGDRVLPFDKADFFGTHIMLCEIKGDEYVPVFAYKATPMDRCLKYHYDFPAFGIFENELHPSCLLRLNEIIKFAIDPSLVSFDSAWAQNLDYRFSHDIELKENLREIMMMVIVKHHQDFNIPHMITAGAVKVKTDLFFLRMGLNMLNEHARFFEKKMENAEGVIFYNNTFSNEALDMAKKYQNLWDKRLTIDGQKARVSKVAA